MSHRIVLDFINIVLMMLRMDMKKADAITPACPWRGNTSALLNQVTHAMNAVSSFFSLFLVVPRQGCLPGSSGPGGTFNQRGIARCNN